MRFRSAVDPWYYAAIAGTAVLLAVALTPLALQCGARGLALAAATSVVPLGLPLWLLASTVYEVEGGVLRVRSGPFRWSIPLAEIERVAPSRSWLSSPALSLDRLELLRADGRRILLSPRDREGFLAAIGHASPADAGPAAPAPDA